MRFRSGYLLLGLAVAAAIFLLMSVSWLWVLMAFLLGGLGFACWTWSSDRLEGSSESRISRGKGYRIGRSPGNFTVARQGNIYSFPEPSFRRGAGKAAK